MSKIDNEYLIHILKEMCHRVNADYAQIDFFEHNWFLTHEWNASEEEDFKSWIVDYLYENKDARNYLMRFPRKNKKDLKKLADEFVFNYGWKTKLAATT